MSRSPRPPGRPRGRVLPVSVAMEIELELAYRSLANFIRDTWHIVEPTVPLVWNWHIDVICAELEAITFGQRPGVQLVICIPPGHMKSLLVSVFWPSWQWLRKPGERTLFLSNDGELVKRDSRRTRDIIASDVYKSMVSYIARRYSEQDWSFAKDQNTQINFANTMHGFRQCMAIGAAVTGKRGNGLVIDDPYDVKEVVLGSTVQVAKRMREVVDVYDYALSSRLNDLKTGYRVLIMQRVHQGDLAGVLLERMRIDPSIRCVVLPSEYDPDHEQVYVNDPRRASGPVGQRDFDRDTIDNPVGNAGMGAGALLFPAKFDANVLAKQRTALGSRHYAAQHGQRAVAAEGGLYKRAWFQQRYDVDPQRLIVDEWALTLDCTFKKADDNDFVVMQCWGRKRGARAMYYLLDQVRLRMTYTETRQRFREFAAKWQFALLKLVEDKANGTAIIDDLKATVPGLVAYDPQASKEARAELAAVAFEAGNVWLPTERYASWIGEYVDEFCDFPAAIHDDQVDATAQLIIRWMSEAHDPVAQVQQQWGVFLGED